MTNQYQYTGIATRLGCHSKELRDVVFWRPRCTLQLVHAELLKVHANYDLIQMIGMETKKCTAWARLDSQNSWLKYVGKHLIAQDASGCRTEPRLIYITGVQTTKFGKLSHDVLQQKACRAQQSSRQFCVMWLWLLINSNIIGCVILACPYSWVWPC